MSYSLKLHRSVEKQLSRIPEKFQVRIINAMRTLRDNPRPHGCVKLDQSLYRIRVGQYRVIYALFDEELIILVVKVARRSEATYRDLRKLLDWAIDQAAEDEDR